MRDHKELMDTLEQSELKPYSEEERKETDKKIEEVIIQKLTREKVEQIFNYGLLYELANNKTADWLVGQFPTDDYDRAIDYVYRLIVENERDEECLRCQRYYSGSCVGTINRGRETITDSNRCAAFISKGGY